MGRRAEAGFTLLELLVGIVVLGFILAALAGGSRYGLRASDAQTRLIDGRGELDAVDRTLRRLITESDPGTSHDPPSFQGGAARLAFISTLPEAVTGFAGQPADVALGVDPERRLVLRWTPHLHVRRIGPPPPPREAELLRGVDHIELAYWLNGWKTSWDAPTLPALVRLRIVFAGGDPRHWPDIIVAPLRGKIL
jgi:general secretion pathway protein J